MKSAYELALEKMSREGIEPPSQTSLDEADRQKVEEIRRRAQAKIAELEILRSDEQADLSDPLSQQSEYSRERARILEQCERDVAAIRSRDRR